MDRVETLGVRHSLASGLKGATRWKANKVCSAVASGGLGEGDEGVEEEEDAGIWFSLSLMPSLPGRLGVQALG